MASHQRNQSPPTVHLLRVARLLRVAQRVSHATRRTVTHTVATVALVATAALVPLPPASDAQPTQGTLQVVDVPSRALHHSVRVLIYEPAGYTSSGSYPTLYLLHGTPGDPDSLVSGLHLQTALDAAIARGTLPPLVAVVPMGGPSRTADTEWADSARAPHQRWGTFVAHDLVDWIDHHHATQHRAKRRAIAGISMGGYGAMNIALQHRAVFGAAGSWSGYFEGNTPGVEGDRDSPTWRRASPMIYVPGMASSLRQRPLAMSFYVGRRDAFFPENLAFHTLLRSLRIAHRFTVARGGHTWDVWNRQLPPELAWLGAMLRR